jgi:hypothetical protein
MDTLKKAGDISDDDLRAALKDMGTYVDVTEEDLEKIYSITLKQAEERLQDRASSRRGNTVDRCHRGREDTPTGFPLSPHARRPWSHHSCDRGIAGEQCIEK